MQFPDPLPAPLLRQSASGSQTGCRQACRCRSPLSLPGVRRTIGSAIFPWTKRCRCSSAWASIPARRTPLGGLTPSANHFANRARESQWMSPGPLFGPTNAFTFSIPAPGPRQRWRIWKRWCSPETIPTLVEEFAEKGLLSPEGGQKCGPQ